MRWLTDLRDRWRGKRTAGAEELEAAPPPPKLALEDVLSGGFPEAIFQEVSEPSVSIIVPAHGELDMTLRCLESIAAARGSVPYEVIVVDDGSDPPLTEPLGRIQGLQMRRNLDQKGFVDAANRGAEAASGHYLLFLNNDTLVTDGWLDALWRRAHDAQVGLVGAQLIAIDGSVQEAGGIIWRDGTATNYGRGSHPDAPEVSYSREVDYCSGACLLVARELFEELGGFDRTYAPGYYEDVDLAFAVRKRGLTVQYESSARVYHEEGGTAGTDPRHGMKQHQELNRARFIERWGRELESQPPRSTPVDVAKDRGIDRRCLVVDHRMPTPDRDAGSLRLVRILEELIGFGWRPTVAPYDLLDSEADRRRLEAVGIEVLRRPFVDHLDRYLRHHETGFDVILLSRVDVAHRLVPIVRRRFPQTTIVFDTVDLKSVRDQRHADLLGSAKLRRAAEQTRRRELEVIDQVDATLVTSRVERDYLRHLRPNASISVVPTWYPIVKPEMGFERRSGALFIGGFRHLPNVDGLEWFLTEVMPKVRRLVPHFQLQVIGEDPPEQLTRHAAADVVFHGHVLDVSSFFQRAKMSIAPLRFGSGLKGKVHHSLALGLPCVATPIAAEGMGLMPAVHVALAESASDFADAILQVHSNIDLWQRLSIEGQRHMETYFSEATLRAGLVKALGRLTG